MPKLFTNLVRSRRADVLPLDRKTATPVVAITIVTPTLNAATRFDTALCSVKAQNYTPLQHIVVDGGSTDGTDAIVARYPGTEWIVTPGNAHAAINFGLARARGEIVGLLSSDDYLEPASLAAVARFFEDHPQALAVRGLCYLRDGDDAAAPEQEFVHLGGADAWLQLLYGTPATLSWFFRRDLFSRIGLFDETLHFSADRLFLLKTLIASRGDVPILNVPLYTYQAHRQSMTLGNNAANSLRYVKEHIGWAGDLAAICPPAGRRREQLLDWRVFEAYQACRLSLDAGEYREASRYAAMTVAHPIRFIRARLTRRGFLRAVARL